MNGNDITGHVSTLVYQLASDVGWPRLSVTERQRYYEEWTVDPRIGRQLRSIMAPNRIRVHLKDTIMKSYSRTQRPPLRELLAEMSVRYIRITRDFEKPEAVLCSGVDLFTLVAAKDWRVGVTSAFEPVWELPNMRTNVVFVVGHDSARFSGHAYRTMIETAATRLGASLHWV